MSERVRRGAPPAAERLTRAAVVARATTMLERRGLPAFSLRALATDLGVRPSALYNHVQGRGDLLTAIADAALAGFRLEDGRTGPNDQQWDDWLLGFGHRLRTWLLDRPEVAALIVQRGGSTTTGPALLTAVMDRLEALGLDRASAHLAWHAVYTVVIGAVQQDVHRRMSRDGTFDAVLEVTVNGLTAAQRPAAAAARLAADHGVAGTPADD